MEFIKNDIKRAINFGEFNIQDMSMDDLEFIKNAVSNEIKRQSARNKVSVIRVGCRSLNDKFFLEKDIDKAYEYARKKLDGLISKKSKCISVEVTYEKLDESNLKSYLSMRGEFE